MYTVRTEHIQLRYIGKHSSTFDIGIFWVKIATCTYIVGMGAALIKPQLGRRKLCDWYMCIINRLMYMYTVCIHCSCTLEDCTYTED